MVCDGLSDRRDKLEDMFEMVLRERSGGDRPGPPRADIVWPAAEQWSIDVEHPADAAMRQLDEAQLRLQRAEATRIIALIGAYEAGMIDLAERYGADARARDGLPARAVLKQAAMLLRGTERTVAHLLDTATVLRDSFPVTWAVFTSGGAPWRAMDVVAREAIGLHPDVLPGFDAVSADLVTTATPGKLGDRLRRARERLQDDTATARAAVTAANRRVEFDALPDGETALTIRGPAVELVAIDHALTQAAVAAHGYPDEDRTIAQLRFDTALDLLVGGIAHAAHPHCSGAAETGVDAVTGGPASSGAAIRGESTATADSAIGAAFPALVPRRAAVVPTVAIKIPALAWLGRSTEQAILAGYGPIDLGTARALCADAPSLLRVLTDPVTGVRVVMDRAVYRPPPDLQRWLRVRDETCAGLGCRRAAHLCDIDHITEWHDGGRTEDTNLVHLCRTCHLVKSTGLWTTALTPERSLAWTSPWGRT